MHVAPRALAEAWPLHAVVIHGTTRAVVLGHHEGEAIVARIVRKRLPAHRSDVTVRELADLAAMALPGGVYLIRTASTYRQTQGVQIGTCTPEVVSAIKHAIRRERDGQTAESRPGKFFHGRTFAPGCRQVGAMPGC